MRSRRRLMPRYPTLDPKICRGPTKSSSQQLTRVTRSLASSTPSLSCNFTTLIPSHPFAHQGHFSKGETQVPRSWHRHLTGSAKCDLQMSRSSLALSLIKIVSRDRHGTLIQFDYILVSSRVKPRISNSQLPGSGPLSVRGTHGLFYRLLGCYSASRSC